MEAVANVPLELLVKIMRAQPVSWILEELMPLSRTMRSLFRSDLIWKAKYLEDLEADIMFLCMSKEVETIKGTLGMDLDNVFEEDRLKEISLAIHMTGGRDLGLTVPFIQSCIIREGVKAGTFQFSDKRGPEGRYYYLFVVLWASLNHAWVTNSGVIEKVASFRVDQYADNLTKPEHMGLAADALLHPSKYDWMKLSNGDRGLDFQFSTRNATTVVFRKGFKPERITRGNLEGQKEPHIVIEDTTGIGLFSPVIGWPFSASMYAMSTIAAVFLEKTRPGSAEQSRIYDILMRHKQSLRYLSDKMTVTQTDGSVGIFITTWNKQDILHSQNANKEGVRVWLHPREDQVRAPAGSALLGCQLCGASQESARLYKCDKCENGPYWCGKKCFNIGRATGLGCGH